jgi:hypothetical protein
MPVFNALSGDSVLDKASLKISSSAKCFGSTVPVFADQPVASTIGGAPCYADSPLVSMQGRSITWTGFRARVSTWSVVFQMDDVQFAMPYIEEDVETREEPAKRYKSNGRGVSFRGSFANKGDGGKEFSLAALVELDWEFAGFTFTHGSMTFTKRWKAKIYNQNGMNLNALLNTYVKTHKADGTDGGFEMTFGVQIPCGANALTPAGWAGHFGAYFQLAKMDLYEWGQIKKRMVTFGDAKKKLIEEGPGEERQKYGKILEGVVIKNIEFCFAPGGQMNLWSKDGPVGCAKGITAKAAVQLFALSFSVDVALTIIPPSLESNIRMKRNPDMSGQFLAAMIELLIGDIEPEYQYMFQNMAKDFFGEVREGMPGGFKVNDLHFYMNIGKKDKDSPWRWDFMTKIDTEFEGMDFPESARRLNSKRTVHELTTYDIPESPDAAQFRNPNSPCGYKPMNRMEKKAEKKERMMLAFQDCELTTVGELLKCAGPILISQAVGFLAGPPKRNGQMCIRNQACGSGNCHLGFCMDCGFLQSAFSCDMGNGADGTSQMGGCAWMPKENNCAGKNKVGCSAAVGCAWPQHSCSNYDRWEMICRIGCNCHAQWGPCKSTIGQCKGHFGQTQCSCDPHTYVDVPADQGTCEGTYSGMGSEGECKPRKCSRLPSCPHNWATGVSQPCTWDGVCDGIPLADQNPAYPSGCDYRLEEAAAANAEVNPDVLHLDERAAAHELEDELEGEVKAARVEKKQLNASQVLKQAISVTEERKAHHQRLVKQSAVVKHVASLHALKAHWRDWVNLTSTLNEFDDHDELMPPQDMLDLFTHEVFMAGHPEVWEHDELGKMTPRARAAWKAGMQNVASLYRKLGHSPNVPVTKRYWRTHLHGAALDHLIGIAQARQSRAS